MGNLWRLIMPREHIDYRPVLEQLTNHFGEKRQLSAADVGRYDGCCARTAQKRYDIGKNGIDITVLARKKCRM